MSADPDVPYRLSFTVEVPGTAEQVWHAIATAQGLSSWYLPTELEERVGGAVRFTIGAAMGADAEITGWEPPHRLAFDEDWAGLMGTAPGTLSPLTCEFLVEARSGGTCVVRVTSSGFGTGADWEQEWWDGLGPGWRPYFDNLRLYLTLFPGQEATRLEAAATHPGDVSAVWSTLRAALGLGGDGAAADGPPVEGAAVEGAGDPGSAAPGATVDRRAAVEVCGATGTVERVADRQALIRLTAPVPGMLSVFAQPDGEGGTTAGVRAYLFSADAAGYVRREERAWQAWLEGLAVQP